MQTDRARAARAPDLPCLRIGEHIELLVVILTN